jgi:hypothetical protein
VLTELPEIMQPVSLIEKPEPVTLTVEPAGAEVGLSTIKGLLATVVELDTVWVELVATTLEVVLVCAGVVVCSDVELLLTWPETVKSSLTFTPVRVTVLVIGPKPGPEAVTVMVPEVPIGMA